MVTLAVDVIPENDFPIVDTALGLFVSETGSVQITSALLSVTDMDIADDPSTIEFTVDSLPTVMNGETDLDKLAGFYVENELTGVISRVMIGGTFTQKDINCLLHTSPSPRDATLSRMPSSA